MDGWLAEAVPNRGADRFFLFCPRQHQVSENPPMHLGGGKQIITWVRLRHGIIPSARMDGLRSEETVPWTWKTGRRKNGKSGAAIQRGKYVKAIAFRASHVRQCVMMTIMEVILLTVVVVSGIVAWLVMNISAKMMRGPALLEESGSEN